MVTQLDKNTALLLIDLQNGVIQLPLAHPVDAVVANCALLLAAFRKARLPVVIVNVKAAGPWTTIRKEPGPQRPPNKENWMDIIPEIKSMPDDIFITKPSWGAFYDTGLDDELKKRGITGIVIAGIATSIGVEGTARQAVVRGYNLTFALDAVTDMFIEAHEHSLKYIFPRIGEIDTTGNIIAELGAR